MQTAALQDKERTLIMRTGENIFKRKDGRWEARYHKGRDPSGKLLYGFCYGKTYSEAKARMEEAKKTVPAWTPYTKENLRRPLYCFCEEWLRINQPRLHASTYVKYQSVLEKYIRPQFGGFYPDEVTSQAISDFTQTLLYEKNLSPKTVNDILLIFHSALEYTRKNFSGRMNDIEIIYPKKTQGKIRVLSVSEQKILTEYLLTDMDLCKFGVLLSLWTGLRIGEICALRCGNISLCDESIQVESTMQRLKKQPPDTGSKTSVLIGPPKSPSSVRLIPLTEQTLDLCKKMLPDGDDAFVLSGTTRYIEPRALQFRFQKYVDDCNLKDVHFHTLRHTFATRCIEAGVDVKSLSEILGHSNATITMNRYVHCSMDMKRKNLGKLDLLCLG